MITLAHPPPTEPRYTYLTPPWLYGMRKHTAPFVSFWYCQTGPTLESPTDDKALEDLMWTLTSTQGKREKGSGMLHIGSTVEELPKWARDMEAASTWNSSSN